MGGRGGGSGRGGGMGGGANSHQGEEWKSVINQNALRDYTHGFKSTSASTETRGFDAGLRTLKAEISKNPTNASSIAQTQYDQAKAEMNRLGTADARTEGGYNAVIEKRGIQYGRMRAAEFVLWSLKGGK